MRQRSCAALLLCGPLVAGCGAATRIDFSGHSRPASPVQVSVLVPPTAPGSSTAGAIFDPIRVRPGLVLFVIDNQSAYVERFSVRERGRLVAQTPTIAPGQTAQLKASLRGSDTFGTYGREPSAPFGTEISRQSLDVSGPPRTGNNELTQP